MAGTIRRLTALGFILLFLITFAYRAEALNAGCEMVRVRETGLQTKKEPLPPLLPLPDNDQSWALGIFMPLSGEYVAIAQRWQQGFALGISRAAAGRSFKWHLLLTDSAEISPEIALKHFKDDHATIILGPIQSKLAQPTALAALQNDLPLILLAPQPELAELGEMIFQHFLSAANQAREIARFIEQREEKEEKKVALLHPDNDFGLDFAKAFLKAWPEGTSTPTKISTYDPAATDFSLALTALQAPNPADPEVPEYIFTTLVIADFYPRLRLLAPQLSFHNLDQCQLYGTRGGNDSRLESEAGSSLEGAIFFDLDLNLPKPPPEADNYRVLYLKTYGEEPSIYDAYAYDTITILNQARAIISCGQAAGLAQALRRLPPLQLATGATTLSASGEFAKRLSPIIFRNRVRHNLQSNDGVSGH